ncbi:MAG: sugar ABC transporter ATP-binding protein [Tepidisphaeraceae bacterium]
MPGALLQLTSICKSFGGVCALEGVSFELNAGEVHALVGENGAGKSTLIKIITGAVQADSGSIQLGGAVLARNDPSLSRGLGIAAIYQQPALFPDLSVAENMALRVKSGEPWRLVRWGRRRASARELLGRIGADVSCDALVRDLTMPQQQIVEIAGALGAEAKILILDEPTSSLTHREVENLFRVIRQLKQQGVGMIYISHRMDELPVIADRVTVLRDGKCVGTRAMAEAATAELIRMMVGRELSDVFAKAAAPLGDVVLQTKDLSCGESGVRGINLRLRSGEILGLAGLVGAGRSELARVLFGLTPADRGEIFVRGKSVRIDSPAKAVRLGIAYVPEDRRRYGVILEMPVAANTTLAILRQISRAGLLDLARERQITGAFVERLGTQTPSLDAPVGQLSGGNQQKVALARWLATEPTVMILDEPTQGVDVGAKAEIHRLMSELAGRGLAILMISSELPEILGWSDRIAVMRGGSIVGELDQAEANQEKVLEMALGHAASEALA